MSETIIIAIIGVIGVIFSSLLSFNTARKDLKVKTESNQSSELLEIITKYKVMCDDLEKKVEALETKVNKLEEENTQLRSIMSSHGIQLIDTGGN